MGRDGEKYRKKVNYFSKSTWNHIGIDVYFTISRGIEMIKLQGTEKQIEWAESIRKNAISELREFITKQMRHVPVENLVEAGKLTDSIIDALLNQKEASFWIDNRYYSNSAEYLMGETKIIEIASGEKQPVENWYKIGFALVQLGK